MNLKKILLVLVISLSLQGCIPLLVGGAAATAAVLIVHDKRSTPQKEADSQLQSTIEKKLDSPLFKDQCHLIVNVFNSNVLLAGQAPSKELKLEIERIVLTTPGINKLYNEIIIEAPNSTLTRMSDEWINTKIRLNINNDKSLKKVALNIVTENGVVYLMGNPTRTQSQSIVRIVRKTSGVQRVVTMFN